MTKKTPTKTKEFKWNPKRLKAAKMLAESTMKQEKIAEEVGIHETTLSKWKQEPEFLEKVDDFTLAYEKATKAGLLREAYKGLHLKEKKIESDKSTHLDYWKAIADIQGHNKQTIKHEGNAGVNVVFYLPGNNRDPDIKVVGEEDGTDNDD